MYMNHSAEVCACGKIHECGPEEWIIGRGALLRLPEVVGRCGANRVFLLADVHTYEAAGRRAEALLKEAGIPFSHFIYDASPEPDEAAVGAAVMHYDPACDLVLAVGSGVIGDISKLLARMANATYVIVATAPSMDGYASSTSSMTLGGLKVSLPSRGARFIIGDTEILKNAPMDMLISGLGDMLAKYVSIAEWRIAHVVTGEYYCEAVATLIRDSLNKCVTHAEGLLRREEAAVEAVFEGLVTAGAAMSYAGASRPASGIEHYFSHLWDMRGVEFGEPVSTHGMQCAVGTLMAARLYEALRGITPDRDKGLAYASAFDRKAWFAALARFLGKGADEMIALEEREQKYSVEKHALRLEVILRHWEELTAIMEREIPPSEEIYSLLQKIGCPTSVEAWGLSPDILPMTFMATKDIRDKYILSRLAFDLGVLEELAATCGAAIGGGKE